jgi:hypothetical protein
MIADYLRLMAEDGSDESARGAEEGIQVRLAEVAPSEVVRMLMEAGAPIVRQLLLRSVRRGLAADRPTWETALVTALADPWVEPRRAASLVEDAGADIRDPSLRAQAARFLMDRAGDDRVLCALGRLAPLERPSEVVDFLWARVPQDGAIEGLGHVLIPEEAGRMESLGARPSTLRALEAAYERTGDPAFQASRIRLER